MDRYMEDMMINQQIYRGNTRNIPQTQLYTDKTQLYNDNVSTKKHPISLEESSKDSRLSLDRELKTTMNFTASQMAGKKNMETQQIPFQRLPDEFRQMDNLNPEQITDLQKYLEQIKIEKINKDARPTNIKFCSTLCGEKTKDPCKPINTWSNSINYPEYPKPVDSDVQEAIPAPFNRVYRGNQTRIPENRQSQNEFRNSFGPGSGIDHRIDMRQTDTRRKTRSDPNFPGCQMSKDFHNPYEYGGYSNQLGSLYHPNYIGPYAANPNDLEQLGISERMQLENFPGAMRNINVESALIQQQLTHGPGELNPRQQEINRFELLPFDPQDPRHIVWTDNMPRGGYPTRVDRLETF